MIATNPQNNKYYEICNIIKKTIERNKAEDANPELFVEEVSPKTY